MMHFPLAMALLHGRASYAFRAALYLEDVPLRPRATERDFYLCLADGEAKCAREWIQATG
jgi:hypothetical protein